MATLGSFPPAACLEYSSQPGAGSKDKELGCDSSLASSLGRAIHRGVRLQINPSKTWDGCHSLISCYSNQIGYPIYEAVAGKFPRGGYNRRRRLRVRGKAAPTTTTERPFVRVWNSLIRSVQPNFGLRNLTNPLVNLFNNGNANFIETVPLQAQSYAETQDTQQKPPSQTATTKNPNKRKRKRRKQQKQRPSYDSVEQLDDPYDPYYSSDYLRLSLAHQQQQQQPMFYYGPNLGSYYDTRRLQALNDYAALNDYTSSQVGYYDPLFDAGSAPIDDQELEYASDEELGKLNTKKLTVLRPLSLTIKLPSNTDTNDESEVNDNAAADEVVNDVANDENDVEASVGNKPEDGSSSTANEIATAALSESMRNALGTYMRDDPENRQRQRQSEKPAETETPAVERPRQRHHLFFTARLFKSPRNHQ